MIRWLRVVAIGTVVVSMVGIGVCVGLFLVANGSWVEVNVPTWLRWLFGDLELDVWLPALIAGWLLAVVSVVAGLLWSMFYVWRRRQYEALIARLERELAALRNLPFTNPAPLEDLPEVPNVEAARVLSLTSGTTSEESTELDVSPDSAGRAGSVVASGGR